MSLVTRFKRAAREILGLRQWPRIEDVTATDFEEQIYKAVLSLVIAASISAPIVVTYQFLLRDW